MIISRGGRDYTSKTIKVICPINEPIEEINHCFQDLFNINHIDYVEDHRGKRWRIGDRVMMIVNNYTINVMNGDEGQVVETNSSEIVVNFGMKDYIFRLESSNKGLAHLPDDEELEEKFSRPKIDRDGKDVKFYTDDLELSYALTVHKSQGSEWDYIIVYIPPGITSFQFLSQNLIYTALTRCHVEMWLVGEIEIFQTIVHRKIELRNEGMKNFFRKK